MDPNVTAISHYRPFYNRIGSERSCNLWLRELGVLEAHHRGAGDDAQIVDCRKASDDLLCHSIRKIFLFWVA